ncbi:MAG: hypothetical protein ABSB94_03005 [Syntrophorhabdales bacterium]
MSVSLAPPARFKAFYPGTGNPLSGGQLWTLMPGTSGFLYPKATYTDSTGLTANMNPVILDPNGEADVWLSGYTKLVLQDSAGNLVWSKDNVSSVPAGGMAVGQWQWVNQTLLFTYINGTQFSVPGDETALFLIGIRLQATVTAGTIYGTVIAASFSSSVTTVTVSWDSGALDSGLSTLATGVITPIHNCLPFPPAYISNYPSLTAAIASIGTAPKDLLINVSTTVTAATTVPANISLLVVEGGLITNSGGTFTINGSFRADGQAFSGFSSGQVIFGPGSVKEVYPEWWGAVSGATDSMAAIQAAVDTGLRVKLSGTYTLNNSSSSLMVCKASVGRAYMEGTGWNTLTFTSSANPGITVQCVGGCTEGVTLRNLYLYGPGGTTAGNIGIYFPGGTGNDIGRILIDGVRIQNFGDDALKLQGLTGPTWIRIWAYYCNGYGIHVCADANGNTPSNVTISGGAIHNMLGGISLDGTGASISLAHIEDTDIELPNTATRPCLYLNNAYGNTIINLTTSSGAASLTLGDANVYLAGYSYGNIFVGAYNIAGGGLNNVHDAGSGYNNTWIGGTYANIVSPPGGLGYFAVVNNAIGDTFINPLLTGTYASNLNTVYENSSSPLASICYGIQKLFGGATYPCWHPIFTQTVMWQPNGGSLINGQTSVISANIAFPGVRSNNAITVAVVGSNVNAYDIVSGLIANNDQIVLSLYNPTANGATYASAFAVLVTVWQAE